VSGEAKSNQGVGVHGAATSTTGATTGVLGTTASTANGAIGVVGKATGANGFLNGVWGETASNAGNGVYGYAPSGTGYTGGVSGESSSSGGVGVWGYSGGGSTGTMGVTGPNDPGPIGKTGVFGIATQAVGQTRGVVGRTVSPDGVGVTGVSGTGLPTVLGYVGVHGVSAGRGVFGQSGAGQGVHGHAPTGEGVRGTSTDGIGVRAGSQTGTAVYADTSGLKTGLALWTVGTVRFDNCVGAAIVRRGRASVVVTPGIDLTPQSIVTATLMGSAGAKTTVWRVSVNQSNDTFTVFLTAVATQDVRVGWHVFG
jgi:hypothetical protein